MVTHLKIPTTFTIHIPLVLYKAKITINLMSIYQVVTLNNPYNLKRAKSSIDPMSVAKNPSFHNKVLVIIMPINTSKCSINRGLDHKGHCVVEINQEKNLLIYLHRSYLVEEIDQEFRKSSNTEAAHVIIHCGTNNLTTNSANECVKKIKQLCSTARSVYANAQIGVSSLTERYDLSVRDRGAIFGLRGPNAELPIGGGKLAGATTIGINKLPLQKNFFTNWHKTEKLKITIL